jgi:hypothetical protein
MFERQSLRYQTIFAFSANFHTRKHKLVYMYQANHNNLTFYSLKLEFLWLFPVGIKEKCVNIRQDNGKPHEDTDCCEFKKKNLTK